eukprot:Nitzschia sp. Nitz4//scaffold236_size30323//4352//6175//NITZ4_007984-RA/size30323-processed-gene-0.20-mRNA-1//-1//CDS//3329543481//424//frame0
MYAFGLCFFFALTPTHALSLRGQGVVSDAGRALIPSDSYCYCEGCTSSALEQLAGGHTCGNRMSWLQDNLDFSEVEACRLVAAVEFPNECGLCNPNTCQVQQLCGDIPTCTVDVLETMACDDSKGECFQCGERIKYLLAMGFSNADACHRVTVEEFPSECGMCSAASSVAQTEPPTSNPTMEPTPSPTPPSSQTCGTSTCTLAVLNTQACDATMGGCYTCGDRIEYMVSDLHYTETDACEVIASLQFPDECGGCSPSKASLTAPPTPTPTVTPVETPIETGSRAPVSYDMCFSQSCTQEVLDTEACDSLLGGCYTCGERLDYLISELGYSETAACQAVGYSQFPTICGGCRPEYSTETIEPVDESTLVWSDEFDYVGSPDPTKWTYDLGTGSWGWGNNELQHYTDRLDNVFVEDGVLHIRAVREDYEGSPYTSARIKTMNMGDWTYGRVQVRVRLLHGTARGSWAAAWMLSTDDKYSGWPASGEIDIMEHVGYDAGRVHGTVHTQSYNHMIGTQDGSSVLMDTSDWRVHEIIWTPEKIDFILDGYVFHTFERDEDSTYAEWPFDERFHLILNVAVGGGWGGLQGVDEASFAGDGQIMEVDWVRVYSS